MCIIQDSSLSIHPLSIYKIREAHNQSTYWYQNDSYVIGHLSVKAWLIYWFEDIDIFPRWWRINVYIRCMIHKVLVNVGCFDEIIDFCWKFDIAFEIVKICLSTKVNLVNPSTHSPQNTLKNSNIFVVARLAF